MSDLGLRGIVLTRTQMKDLTTDQSIYMIFRVFGMTNGSIGAMIYVDPDKMREENLLMFSADKWTITPGPRLFL